MLKNYILIALRNLSRNKFYAFINIFGLSIGILCTLFIALFIKDELTYDKHHKNYKRIYRIESHIKVGDKVHRYALTPIPLGKALKAEFPEIAEVVRLFRNVAGQAFVVRYKDK